MIKIEHVSKTFNKDIKAIDDISLDIQDSQTVNSKDKKIFLPKKKETKYLN